MTRPHTAKPPVMTKRDREVQQFLYLVILCGSVGFVISMTSEEPTTDVYSSSGDTILSTTEISLGLRCEHPQFNISDHPPLNRSVVLGVRCRSITDQASDKPTVAINYVWKEFSLRYLSASDGQLHFLLTYLSSIPQTNVTHSANVAVTFRNEASIVLLRINVMDLNDAPENVGLTEKVQEGEVGEWQIPVQDLDAMQPRPSMNASWGDLTITSTDMPPEFAIIKTNRTHFMLRLLRPLDAEDERWYNGKRNIFGYMDEPNGDSPPGGAVRFTLTATDGGGLSTTGTVYIKLGDVNDNKPHCGTIPPILAPKSKSMIYPYRPIFNPIEYCRDDDVSNMYTTDFRFFGTQECQDAFEIFPYEVVTVLIAGRHYPPTGKAKCKVSIVIMDKDFAVPVSFDVVFRECPAGVDSIFNTTWETGWPGTYTKTSCPPGYDGEQARLCDKDGVYRIPIINCTSSVFRDLEQEAKKSNNMSAVLEHLANLTFTNTTGNTTGKPLSVGDVTAATNILAITSERVRRAAFVDIGSVKNFLAVANNLMAEPTNLTWQSMISNNVSGVDRVLNSIDDFIETVTGTINSTDFNQTHVKSNLYVTYGRDSHCQQGLDFPNRTSADVPVWAKDTPDRIFMPCGKDIEGASYSTVMYRDLREIIPSWVGSDRRTLNETLNSVVMSMSLYPRKNTTLEKPVTITFKLLTKKESYEPKCSYWKEGSGSGYWSTEGCVLISFDAGLGTAVCQCDHLTNFAILMSPVPDVPSVHTQVLSIISLVGCIISMTFLAITIGVHLYFWRKVSGERTVLLLNLCVTLFLAYLVFLAGVDKVSNKDACTFVAVLLHFIYLVVFFTMLAKGALLAKTVLKPFNKSPFAKWGILASYGVAAIIVGVAMGVTRLDGYGSSTTCWLSVNKGLIWAFVGPVLLVVMVNVGVIVIVMKQMYGTTAMLSKTIREKAKVGVRGMGVLLPVLGVTWIFGVFSVNEDTVIFQYLFAICNSLQGLLIFVFHCVLNKKVKDAVTSSWSAVSSSDSVSSDKKAQTSGTDL